MIELAVAPCLIQGLRGFPVFLDSPDRHTVIGHALVIAQELLVIMANPAVDQTFRLQVVNQIHEFPALLLGVHPPVEPDDT